MDLEEPDHTYIVNQLMLFQEVPETKNHQNHEGRFFGPTDGKKKSLQLTVLLLAQYFFRETNEGVVILQYQYH